MLRYLPIGIVATVIAAATVYNGAVTERWSGGVNKRTVIYAEALKALPTEIGDWQAEDYAVDNKTLRTAGAVGHISRSYKNQRTNEQVQIWLIVGHGHGIVKHTPDICYPSDGYRHRQKSAHYEMPVEGEKTMKCWTSLFTKVVEVQELKTRVFWMWYDPRDEGSPQWRAPGHHVKDARFTFGGAKTLFKLYLTTSAASEVETPKESVANTFAQEFVPVLNELLLSVKSGEYQPTGASDQAPATPDEAAKPAEAA